MTDSKKAEAAARMKKLGIPDKTIKRFVENNVISQSLPPDGEYSMLGEEQILFARELENKFDILVYFVIHNDTSIGEIDSYLYVGSEEHWKTECEGLKYGQTTAYFHACKIEEHSEFCNVGVEKLPNGGLRCSGKII